MPRRVNDYAQAGVARAPGRRGPKEARLQPLIFELVANNIQAMQLTGKITYTKHIRRTLIAAFAQAGYKCRSGDHLIRASFVLSTRCVSQTVLWSLWRWWWYLLLLVAVVVLLLVVLMIMIIMKMMQMTMRLLSCCVVVVVSLLLLLLLLLFLQLLLQTQQHDDCPARALDDGRQSQGMARGYVFIAASFEFCAI
jgi:hypothetical protein